MALIWAEGFTGDKALAPMWRRYVVAKARADNHLLPPQERGTALSEAERLRHDYDATLAKAEIALGQTAANGQTRMHALVAGVGNYKNAGIPALTTSVRGAWAFANWMLTGFQNAHCPLGSLEVLLSPGKDLGDWTPSPKAAARLGLRGDAHPETLPVEAATFANLRDAFERWLRRAGAHLENAAFFYFSGHGLWKSEPLLLPEDARLPTATESLANLIGVQRTFVNMFNRKPSVQCFFLDACQDIAPALIQNLETEPGQPLCGSINAPRLPKRDSCGYLGSYTGMKAYGPPNEAPFFTQELLACLERRAADPTHLGWPVTTDSLRKALEAAAPWRSETENQTLLFSTMSVGTNNFTAKLCEIPGPREVFVMVRCVPPDTMQQAKLYVEYGGQRHFRPAVLTTEWYTTVGEDDCLAGVEFDPIVALENTGMNFRPVPPRHPVQLEVKPHSAHTGSGTGGGEDS